MKYYETSYLDLFTKKELEKIGLYSYDIRADDFCNEPATIEKQVYVNKIGSIITDKPIIFNVHNFKDYESFLNENEIVYELDELIDDNKYIDYGEIDLSDDEMIKHEFNNTFNSCDNFEEISKLTPKEKKEMILERYHNVNDYALIENTLNKYKLFYIEKEKVLEDLER
ncbi:MAG: hypothetical protein Q4G04_01380 [bacterium]|nr:hypothetical protein [bacterium]